MIDLDWSVVIEYKDLFIQGLITNIELTTVAVAIGLVIGVLLGMMLISTKKWLKIPARVYVHLFRGTPLFLQILFFHFAVLPTLAEMFFMDPPDDPFDGKFTVVYGDRSTRMGLFQVLPSGMKPGKGNMVEMDGINEFHCTRLSIHLDKPSPAHTDGEIFDSWVTNLEYKIFPAAVQMLLP